MDNFLIGYGRCSSYTQNLAVQTEQLRSLGCADENIYVDQSVAGTVRVRDGLNSAMNACRPGDTLIVVRLDRLTRDTEHALLLLAELTRRRVSISLGGNAVDPDDPNSVLMFTMLAAMATHEHAIIHQRTRAGIDAAKKRGAYKGGPRKLSREDEKQMCALYKRGGVTQTQLAEEFGVSKMTVIRALKRAEVKGKKGPLMCKCGKHLKHLTAPLDSPDWPCLVPSDVIDAAGPPEGRTNEGTASDLLASKAEVDGALPGM